MALENISFTEDVSKLVVFKIETGIKIRIYQCYQMYEQELCDEEIKVLVQFLLSYLTKSTQP
jgi:hypothetical protein